MGKLVNKGTINENGVKVNDYSPTPPPQQQIKGWNPRIGANRRATAETK